MALDEISKSIGRIALSREKSKELGREMYYAGMLLDVEVLVGYYLLSALFIGLLATMLLFWWPGIFSTFESFVTLVVELPQSLSLFLLFILLEIASFFSVGMLVYAVVILTKERRTLALEAVLPDFLMLVSSNVKSGMTLDQAMWYASKPEFGLLSSEVKKTIKKSFSGQPLEESLNELSARFDSKVFLRTVNLLKQAIATGGEIAEILDRTSEDARESLIIKKEISASLILYEIFVMFAAIVGTPFLFAVSTKLITVLERAFTHIPSTASFQQFSTVLQPSVPIVTSEGFFYFTIAIIFVTSLFSSFIIGVIRTGSKNQGIKYFPFVLVLSYLVYFIVSALLSVFFSNLLL